MDNDLKLKYGQTDILVPIRDAASKSRVAAMTASAAMFEFWAMQTERHVDRDFVVEMLQARLNSMRRHEAN